MLEQHNSATEATTVILENAGIVTEYTTIHPHPTTLRTTHPPILTTILSRHSPTHTSTKYTSTTASATFENDNSRGSRSDQSAHLNISLGVACGLSVLAGALFVCAVLAVWVFVKRRREAGRSDDKDLGSKDQYGREKGKSVPDKKRGFLESLGFGSSKTKANGRDRNKSGRSGKGGTSSKTKEYDDDGEDLRGEEKKKKGNWLSHCFGGRKKKDGEPDDYDRARSVKQYRDRDDRRSGRNQGGSRAAYNTRDRGDRESYDDRGGGARDSYVSRSDGDAQSYDSRDDVGREHHDERRGDRQPQYGGRGREQFDDEDDY